MRRPTIILKYQNDKTVLYGNMICLNFTVKRSQTDFQQACRFRFIAFGVLQDFRDVLLFNYRQFKFFSRKSQHIAGLSANPEQSLPHHR